MKFIVTKPIIYKTLSHLQSIVNKKNTLPILSNILIEAENNLLTLSSTDMDISIKETINCNIVEPGSTTLNAQIMFGIIKKLPETNEIESRKQPKENFVDFILFDLVFILFRERSSLIGSRIRFERTRSKNETSTVLADSRRISSFSDRFRTDLG